jgi:hypothetical protein
MLITKLHLESHCLHPLIYISNPTTSSTTNYLPISEFNKKHHYKSMDDGKEVYAILHTMPSSKRKRDGINFPP